jgi:hypothetical protein
MKAETVFVIVVFGMASEYLRDAEGRLCSTNFGFCEEGGTIHRYCFLGNRLFHPEKTVKRRLR